MGGSDYPASIFSGTMSAARCLTGIGLLPLGALHRGEYLPPEFPERRAAIWPSMFRDHMGPVQQAQGPRKIADIP